MPLTDPYSANTQNTSILKPLSPCILKRTFISIYYKKIYTEQAMYLLELHIACTKRWILNCLGIKICLRAQDQSAITIVWSNQAGIQMLDSKNCILSRLRNTTLLIKMLGEIWCFSPWNIKSKIEKLSKMHNMDMRLSPKLGKSKRMSVSYDWQWFRQTKASFIV